MTFKHQALVQSILAIYTSVKWIEENQTLFYCNFSASKIKFLWRIRVMLDLWIIVSLPQANCSTTQPCFFIEKKISINSMENIMFYLKHYYGEKSIHISLYPEFNTQQSTCSITLYFYGNYQ